ncbi:MAG: hypothetical protein AAFY98_07520 [Verrucomicrobiota bacterium]
MVKVFLILCVLVGLFLPVTYAKSVAYIYGDVSRDGFTPASLDPDDPTPYDQMLLTDTGDTGLSVFKALVETEGYTINQYYDQATTLNADFLNQFEVVIFGLHQKVWSSTEKDALDLWIRAGGGILIYSDSASGGRFNRVGIDNPVGQNVTNNLISQYGMEVTVDQGGGTRSYRPDAGSANPIIWDVPIFEGEGVSPVGVDTSSGAIVLIPFSESNKEGGNDNLTPDDIDAQNVTNVANRTWAVMGLAKVGDGNVIAIFDRQPMWNDGPGSDIEKEDNKEVLRRVVRYLALDYGNAPEWPFVQGSIQTNAGDNKDYLELTYDQWMGGTGTVGVDYNVRNQSVVAQYRASLSSGDWSSGAALFEQVGSAVDNGDETETITLRVLPAEIGSTSSGFARISIVED